MVWYGMVWYGMVWYSMVSDRFSVPAVCRCRYAYDAEGLSPCVVPKDVQCTTADGTPWKETRQGVIDAGGTFTAEYAVFDPRSFKHLFNAPCFIFIYFYFCGVNSVPRCVLSSQSV